MTRNFVMGIIDITVGDGSQNEPEESDGTKRPFLGIRFTCAGGMYARFYRNDDGTAYTGRCPKCLKQVRIGVAPGGTDARFFDYDCGRPT